MGIFDTIRQKAVDAGFVEASEAFESEEVSKSSTPRPSFKQNLVVLTPIGDGVSPDPDIVKALNDAVTASKVTGYEQFRVIFDTMQGIPDAQRYQMALRLAEATHKLSPNVVVASLDDRLRLLDGEQQEFDAALNAEVEKTVVAAQNEIQTITETVEAKKAEIRELEAKRVTLTQQSGAAQVELERERASFNASIEIVRSSLTDERNRLASHLPTTPTSK